MDPILLTLFYQTLYSVFQLLEGHLFDVEHSGDVCDHLAIVGVGPALHCHLLYEVISRAQPARQLLHLSGFLQDRPPKSHALRLTELVCDNRRVPCNLLSRSSPYYFIVLCLSSHSYSPELRHILVLV